MKQYLESLQYILDNGVTIPTRTGIDCLTVTGLQTKYHMDDGFPMVTTKSVPFKSMLAELLFFIEGSTDVKRLKELVGSKFTVWNANGTAGYWTPKAKFDGDLGRIYSAQWRDWKSPVKYNDSDVYRVESIDQLSNVLNDIISVKHDPTLPVARRLIVNAWNPGELDKACLPPCHSFFQFHVIGEYLDLQMYQRSNDQFLGVPWNIASYSLLLHMVAHVTGLTPRTFIHDQGNVHIYENHIEQVKEQLSRDPLPLPKLWLNPDIGNLFDFTMNDVKLLDYEHRPAIKAKMAV